MSTKCCKKCNLNKNYNDFTKRSRSKDGLDTYCKQCNAKKSKDFNKSSDKRRIINKKYADSNRDKILQDMRDWYSKNSDKVKKNVANRIKEREKSDVMFKLTRVLRARLNGAIKRNHKAGSAVKDLGCTIDEFKLYIESKFEPGMTWNNYGHRTWHIDHIQPLASFDLTLPEELKKACHYTNLQPLWAKDNLSKSDKWRK